MSTKEITSENFRETIEGSGLVLMDWWAPWCGPCRAFAPIYEQAAEEHPDAVFGKVNTEEQMELAGAFGIRSIPTLMVFRDGILLFSQPGMLPKGTLDKLIEQVMGLDMDEVRAKIAEESEEAGATGTDR